MARIALVSRAFCNPFWATTRYRDTTQRLASILYHELWRGKDLETKECGLWVDNGPASLAGAIGQISQAPLRVMGERGREWMRKEFSWEDRAKEMLSLYESLTGQLPLCR